MGKPVIFAPGTKVRLIRDHILNAGREGLIEEVSLSSGVVEYSFEGCAWIGHNSFEFLEHPTKKSLKAVMKALDDEEEE